MIRALACALLVAYVPGALLFRLPMADRPTRAGLPAEERVFWHIVLSVSLSLAITLGLAAAGSYRFEYLLGIQSAITLAILAIGRGRLRLGPEAPRPTWTAVPPVALVVLAGTVTFWAAPAEYVMGGKDPGVYMNEGIQIAQNGGLVIEDRTVAAVPPPFRNVFFPPHRSPSYYSTRFMGFFLLDPERGTVAGQFPHLYPASIAVAYGLGGLSGARSVLGVWGVLGVLAVYFLGVRLMGRAAAAAGAGLLAVHVVQVWYSRYPNAELVLQALVYAGLLAYVRAQQDGDRFYRPLAATLFAMGLFAHLTGVFVVAAVAGAAILGRFDGRRIPLSFALPLVAGTAAAAWYFVTFLPAYSAMPRGFARMLTSSQEALLGAAALAGLALWRAAAYPAVRALVRAVVPAALVVAVLAAAGYAYFLRTPQGLLAPQDADALRMFTAFYLSPIGLVLGLAGFVVTVRRSFWASAPFLIVVTLFSFVFFYKLRIIPEHFWVARRFLAVVLPGLLLLAGAAAFSSVQTAPGHGARWLQWTRHAVGVVLIAVLAGTFITATLRILRHVEYAGLIPRLERLAATVADDDLVIVESRNASDVHVLALPLAYTYARNVLVLPRTDPNRGIFGGFLDWAHTRYRRVFFIGGGGTELLSRTTAVEAIAGERFQIPEYESEWNVYPTRSQRKEFDFGVYEFLPGSRAPGPFDLDVGVADDLYVRRFHAKETHADGFTFRWTRDASFVSIVGFDAGCRTITIWMGHGGRPTRAPAAEIDVTLEDRLLGQLTVGRPIAPYAFRVPAELAAELAKSSHAARLQLVTKTWNPRLITGARDGRDLGVMIDRVAACTPTPP